MPRYPQLADAEWLRRHYAEYSAEQVARVLGCHPATVCRWLEKHGIPARPGDHFGEWQARLREWKTGPPTAGQTMYVAVLAGLLGIEEPKARTSVQAGPSSTGCASSWTRTRRLCRARRTAATTSSIASAVAPLAVRATAKPGLRQGWE